MNMKYETISYCDLCGNSNTKLIDQKGHIVQCRRCGLRFMNPRPRQEDISRIYNWNLENRPDWGEIIPEAQVMYEKRFNFIQRFIQGGKLLDVGAGLGVFLSKAKQTNRWQCFGTETSRYAVQFTEKEFGIKLSLGQLENLDYPENYFDAITFWHVLEHLSYPSRAIKETSRILKDKGFLFIAVPNDSWLGRRHFFKNAMRRTINRLPIKKKLRLKKMYPDGDAGGNMHLFYFTPRTLKKLLENSGLKIKKHSVDYDFERPNPKIDKRYRFELLFCQLTGINLSNAILIVAQKKKDIA